MTNLAAPFAPDWVSPPGDSIIDLLEEKDWTQAELAQRLGYTTKHVSQLLNGKVPLTEEAAVRLERVLGGKMGFWLAREAQYRERLAQIESAEKYASWTSWLDVLPVRELMKARVIATQRIVDKVKPAIVESCLKFYGVASPDEWQTYYGGMEVSFRRSRAEQSDVGAISAWLRLGEQAAEKQDLPKYDRARFVTALETMRALTVQEPAAFGPTLQQLFHDSGVAFVMVPSIPGSHVSGVARWLNPHRPLIQLSLYGKYNDKFWFNLFHEAAHILLHANEKKSVFLDSASEADLDSPQEREANQWSREFLIPLQFVAELPLLKSKFAVCDFAERIGVHPGVVVGRLQHDGLIPQLWMNDLRVQFEFAAD